MRILLRFAFFAAASFGALCLLAFSFQRRLLYFPERSTEPAATARAARLGLTPWRTTTGSLRGWRAQEFSGTRRARVLVLHGNAGSALDREYYLAPLAYRGVEVTILEYPGYGPRPGSPSARSLTDAAVDAVDALGTEGTEPLWLIGESLGSGVAARAARLRPYQVGGVLLVTPFARLAEVANHHYPFIPRFLLRDRWAPQDDLTSLEMPVAVLVAGRDEVVTAHQGLQLFAALRGPKRLWEQPLATHNDLDFRLQASWWDEVVAFLGTGSPGNPR